MKTTLIILTIGITTASVINYASQNKREKLLQQRIETLKKDSVLMHTFFEEQSKKYKDFYNEWVNFSNQ